MRAYARVTKVGGSPDGDFFSSFLFRLFSFSPTAAREEGAFVGVVALVGQLPN